MNDALRELYQEVILDHGKKPRNFRPLEQATHCAEGHNPLCGDCVTVQVIVEDGVVREATFQGSGCAISTASASLMTEAIQGKSVEEAMALFDEFRAAVVENRESDDLGKLEVLLGVKEFPVRVKCATLAWHTLQAAIQGEGVASTE
ncbi:MAG TPA: SUF system NifU family Fe-S cluster assembly protein [Fimbriimonadaceae bacterium]|nr:SUF system NifU family Fe-S cluster assembly protein [Fimbriimonadaceae bacterium]